MTFLLVEISLLLVVALLIGAALGALWMRGRFEDVTVEYASAQRRLAESKAGPVQVDLEPIAVRLTALERAIVRISAVDLSPVAQRIDSLERSLEDRRRALDPLHERLGSMERVLVAFDRSGLDARLKAIEDALGRAAVRASNTAAPFTQVTSVPYGGPTPARTPPAPAPVDTADQQTLQAAPERDLAPDSADPLDEARRPEGGANLLIGPVFGPADYLEAIVGVGPKLAALLNQLGVYYFWQVAQWTPDDAALVNDRLDGFKGRIDRDEWVEQCKVLREAPGASRPPPGV
ncbi:MAG: hypothetical protein ABMA64_17540 [Myxococcota bacterium]